MTDFRSFYSLEDHLEQVVAATFHEKGELEAFDFFCMIIWKANRAKSKIAKALLERGLGDLDATVRVLTGSIAAASTPRAKLEVLIKDWGFRIPMASAILTVLYPSEFTIYDTRVCDSLGGFHSLQNRTSMESIWQGYVEFLEAVEETAPQKLSLRDKDRWLWGRSFESSLARDIANEFRSEA